jgi:hypothetical protein
MVLARGGRVVLRLERVLVRIAASLPGNVIITPTRARTPDFDVWCPLLSLPRVFGTAGDSIPATVPYLGARRAIAERWQRRLAGVPGLKVGVVWAGSLNHINDTRRSVKLERLKPLLGIPSVSFVSLQVGPRAADLAALPSAALRSLRRADRLRRDRRRYSQSRSGDRGRYCGSPSRRRIGQAGMADAAVLAGLALAARSRRQPLVSDHATLPAARAGRLG